MNPKQPIPEVDDVPAEDLPRLLVYSHEIPQSGTAGGLLLLRLLEGYPTERLFVAGDEPRRDSMLLDCRYAALRMPWQKLERSRFNKWHRTLRCFGLVPIYDPAALDRTLADFAPQVVLTIMQHGTWFDSALLYCRTHRLPLVALIHDVNESFDVTYGWARQQQRKRDAEFYRYAHSRLCVSPEMELLCRSKYRVHGDVLYPNRDESLDPRPVEDCDHLKMPGTLTLGFAGNLSYGYGEQLVKMLPAVRRASARLIIYGRPPGADSIELQEAHDVVELRGFVDSNVAWERIKRDCDAVVFPYLNPAGRMRLLYSHHFPSKLPEYLALGMPILMVGPVEATGIRWANAQEGAVLVETAPDVEAYESALVRLRDDRNLRRSLAANARAAGDRSFSPRTIKSQLLTALVNAASSQCSERISR